MDFKYIRTRFVLDATRIMQEITSAPRDKIVTVSLIAFAAYGRIYLTLRAGLDAKGLGKVADEIEAEIRKELRDPTDEAQILEMVRSGDRFVMRGEEA